MSAGAARKTIDLVKVAAPFDFTSMKPGSQADLEGQPGGTPVLLTSVAGVPVSISKGWVRKKNTMRIFEATEDLQAFDGRANAR